MKPARFDLQWPQAVRKTSPSWTFVLLVLTSVLGVSAPAVAETVEGSCYDAQARHFAPCRIIANRTSIKIRFRRRQNRVSNRKIPRQKVRAILLESKTSCRLSVPTNAAEGSQAVPLSRFAHLGVGPGSELQYLVKYQEASLGVENTALFCVKRRDARTLTQALTNPRR